MFTKLPGKKLLVVVTALTLGLESLIPTASAIEGDSCFTDVASKDKYYVSICALKREGLLNGYDDGTYRPWDPVNRAEALKMISIISEMVEEEPNALLVGKKEDPPLDEPLFADVPVDAWYNKYLEPAKESGIIEGYSDDTFRPSNTINLSETLKMLFEAAGINDYPENEADHLFADAGPGQWYSPYFAYASRETLLNISPSNEVFPDQQMNRGYFAELMYRFKNRDRLNYGKATFYGKALQGNYTASGEIFDYNLMTAAHKTLPLGSMIRVTNLANGLSIDVKVNDRGPYGYGREVDLSRAAFEEIAWLGTGVIYVQFEVLSTPE